MIRVIRRWLNRNKPFTCRACGWTAPLSGSRWEQAGLAFDHWEAEHEQAGEES